MSDTFKGPKVWVDQMPYPLPEQFTHKEARRVSKITELSIGDLFEDGNEIELGYAYAFVALWREHPQWTPKMIETKLDDLAIGKITLDAGDQEDDEELPPAAAAPDAASSAQLESAKPNGNGSTLSTLANLEPTGIPV